MTLEHGYRLLSHVLQVSKHERSAWPLNVKSKVFIVNKGGHKLNQ